MDAGLGLVGPNAKRNGTSGCAFLPSPAFAPPQSPTIPTQQVVAATLNLRHHLLRLAERPRPLHCAVSLYLPVRCDSDEPWIS